MKIRPYQSRAESKAIAAMEGGGGFLLIPEQRTGKTLIAMRIVKHFQPAYLFIICPKAAFAIWQKATRGMRRVIITNFENLVEKKKNFYRWAKEHRRNFFCICDESHFIKHRGSLRSRTTRTVGKYAKYRLALTGTPIAQGIIDAWAQFNFIDRKIFGRFDDKWVGGLDGYLDPGFDSKYLIWGGYKKHDIVGVRNYQEFMQIFHKHSFRITLREAKREGGKQMILHYRKIEFDLSSRSREIYDTLQKELEVVVNEKKVKVKNVLACVSKLQQVCGGYLINRELVLQGGMEKTVKNILPVGHEKMEQLHQAVRSLQARKKFIVICRFIHELEAVSANLTKLGYDSEIVAGGRPYRGKIGGDCLVMQIQSGISRDMSEADTIFFYSTDYSYLNFEQARFRILSYDKVQGRYVFLLARDTVDEVIYTAVSTKKRLADLIIDKFRHRG